MTKVTDSESPAAGDGLFRSLSPHIRAFDEMTGEDGRIRDHWSHLVKAFTKHGAMEIKARSDNADRILREHGVTYNVYGEAGSIDRPWGVDVAPFLLPASEWERIEAALIQRSRLLNRIMEDLYGGGQRLLRNGFLPPELVYSNPGFLRPCRGIPVPRQVYLHLLACDMVRSASGQWSVLSDRAQAPSGAGYALENRSVLSRVLPDEIRESSVRRLPEFFRRQREMLSALAPEGCQDPNVIVLTPGPRNETYFEHAYLARSLGFTLAEGADLTVRNQRVYLKTVEGLQAVDVILRRLDDAFCDPLELRSDSFLGVAGLVEATRAGTVTLANALGSALVESAAFLPFLEPISRLLLDQELLLPCVPTWWCGRARDLRHVLSQLDSMVVKPAFRTHRSGPWFGGRLSKVELSDLKERIEASPRDFIAQEMVGLSVAPAWIGQAFEPRGVVLRGMVASGGDDSFAVLPGGLTRVAPTACASVVSSQEGGGSKDTWIVRESTQSGSDTSHITPALRTSGRTIPGVPSRAADNLFWLGRYAERLEQQLRMIRCVIGRLSDETGTGTSVAMQSLGLLLNRMESVPFDPARPFDPEICQEAVLKLLHDPGVPGGTRDLLALIRTNASAVRDRFSGDTWRILGRLQWTPDMATGRLPLAEAQTAVQSLVLYLAAFSGMEMENMTRGHGWRFLDLGRRVERAIHMLHMLRSAVELDPHDSLRVLEPLLEMADSILTYRRRYFSDLRLGPVLELLLLDPANPRSVAFQLAQLEDHSRELPGVNITRESGVNLPHLVALRESLASFPRAELARAASVDDQASLLQQLAQLSSEAGGFSDWLATRYFSHSLPRVG